MMIKSVRLTIPTLRQVLSVVGLVLLSMLLGYVASWGSVLFAAALAAAFAGLFLLRFPNFLLLSALAMAMIVGGTLETFAGLGQANWFASAIVSGLFLTGLVSKPASQRLEGLPTFGQSLLTGGILLFVANFVLSALINQNGFAQWLVGFRGYIPFIGIFLVLWLGRISEKTVMKAFGLLMLIAAVQWVYCVAEQLIIVPKRRVSFASSSGDAEAIVGSFGGNPLFGGYTGEMAAFVTIGLVTVLVLRQKDLLPRWMTWALLVSAAVSVGLAETKIVFVLLPLMLFGMLYRFPDKVSRRLIMTIVALIAIFVGFAAVYSVRYWTSEAEFLHAFTYSFDPDFMVTAKERGRIANIIYWWSAVPADGNLVNTIFGFGPAASLQFSSIAGMGSAVIRYGWGLDNNAMSKVLWDFGFIGFSALLMMMAGAFMEATRLSRASFVASWLRWCLVALKAWIVVFVVFLPYQVGTLGGPPMQFIFWFCLGVIAYAGRWKTVESKADLLPWPLSKNK